MKKGKIGSKPLIKDNVVLAPKEEPGKGGSFVSTYTFRPASKFLVGFIKNTPITPNQVTILAFSFGIIASLLILTMNPLLLVLAGIFILIHHTLDCLDGELARVKQMQSKKGALLDEFLDRVYEGTLFFCIAFAAFNIYLSPWIWIIGFFAVVGNMRLMSVSLKLDVLEVKKVKITTEPFWKQALRYGGDLQEMVIAICCILGFPIVALCFIAVAANLFASIRFVFNYGKLD